MSPSIEFLAAALRSTTAVDPPSRRAATPSGWTERHVSPAPRAERRAGSDPSRRPGRIPYIDMARGLFLILMPSTHATTLVGVKPPSLLERRGWPRGRAASG